MGKKSISDDEWRTQMGEAISRLRFYYQGKWYPLALDYGADGCWIKAHAICFDTAERRAGKRGKVVDFNRIKKAWIEITDPALSRQLGWAWHVVACIESPNHNWYFFDAQSPGRRGYTHQQFIAQYGIPDIHYTGMEYVTYDQFKGMMPLVPPTSDEYRNYLVTGPGSSAAKKYADELLKLYGDAGMDIAYDTRHRTPSPISSTGSSRRSSKRGSPVPMDVDAPGSPSAGPGAGYSGDVDMEDVW